MWSQLRLRRKTLLHSPLGFLPQIVLRFARRGAALR